MRVILMADPADGERGATVVLSNADLAKLLDGKACLVAGAALGAPGLLSVTVSYLPTEADADAAVEAMHALVRRGMDAMRAARANVNAKVASAANN